MGHDDDSGKKKMAILGVSSILLVAAVVGTVTYGLNQHNGGGSNSPAGGGPPRATTSSTKAVQSICKHVDYKDTCEDSLAKAKNTSDPRELVKVGFEVTVDSLSQVIKNSTLFKDAAKDPRTSAALETCQYTLEVAIDDFKRAFEKVDNFEFSKVDEIVADLKTWLSGAITFQQTCIDAFENTTGDTGEKMKNLLQTASELSSNGLAMIDQFSNIISSLGIPGFSRRLMSAEERSEIEEDGFPSYVEAHGRKLLQANVASLKPNVTIATDGSGTYKKFRDAINLVPKNNTVPFVIFVKAGVYDEIVEIPRKINNIYIIGEGADKTKLTGHKNYVDGIGTFHTPTLGKSITGIN